MKNFKNIKYDEKDKLQINDDIENQFKQIGNHCKEIKEFQAKNLIIKILLIILLLSFIKLSFNSLKFDLNQAEEKMYQNIRPIDPKNKIITKEFTMPYMVIENGEE